MPGMDGLTWVARYAGLPPVVFTTAHDDRALEAFLRARYHDLPRTTLRYAIERFSPEQRQRYLQGPPPPR